MADNMFAPNLPLVPLGPGTYDVTGNVTGSVTVDGAAPAAPAAPAPAAPAAPKDASVVGSGSPATIGLSDSDPSSSSGSAPAAGRSFSSVGDPHETTGDGLHFDNMKLGTFVKARSESGDFELQTRQDRLADNVTINTAAAAKLGKDTVAYDVKTHQLTINGEAKQLHPGESVDLPDGGKVTSTGQGYALESPKGDKINIQDGGNALNVTGEISDKRAAGEVRGSLGNFDADADQANDLVGGDGKQYTAAQAAEFEESWRAKDGDDLLGGQPGGGGAPAAAGPAPGGNAPDPAAALPAATQQNDGIAALSRLFERLGPDGMASLLRVLELLRKPA